MSSRRWFASATVWALLVAGIFLVAARHESDRWAIAIWLAIPVVLAGGAWAFGSYRPWVPWLCTGGMLGMTLVALASFGMYLLPALVLMFMGSTRRDPGPGSRGEG